MEGYSHLAMVYHYFFVLNVLSFMLLLQVISRM